MYNNGVMIFLKNLLSHSLYSNTSILKLLTKNKETHANVNYNSWKIM